MSKIGIVTMDDDRYNNKREDCMIRKENMIYFR